MALVARNLEERGNVGEILPELFKKNKKWQLSMRNGEKLTVDWLGNDYFGKYNGIEQWRPILDFPAIDWVVGEFNFATSCHWDQNGIIAGRERSGKGAIEWHLLDRLEPKFDMWKDMSFNQDEYFQSICDSKFGWTKTLDEAGEGLFMQDWGERGQKEIIKAYMRHGIKELKTFLVLPHIMLLNKQLRERRVMWWFEVYAKDWDDRGYAQIRRAPLKQNPFETTTYWNGLFTLRFPSYKTTNPKKWAEYEKRKIEAMRESEELSKTRMKSAASRTREMLIKSVERLSKELQWTDEAIAKHYDISTKTVKNWKGGHA